MKTICKIAAVFVLTAAAFGLTAQESTRIGSQAGTDKAVFDRTMKELDTGGLVLNYKNAKETAKFIRELVQLALGQCDPSECDAEKVGKIADELFTESGLSSVQSYGSSVSRNGDIYTFKSFVATDSPRDGLIWDLVGENKPVPELFQYVPQHAILAVGGTVRLKPAYDRVMKLLEKHLPPSEYKDLSKEVDGLKAEGFDLPRQLAAWTGYTLYIENQPGKQPIVPGITGGALILRMADDSLYRTILTKVDPGQVSDGVVMSPDTPLMMTQINGLLVVTTDSNAFEYVRGKLSSTITADPEFRSYAEGMPGSASCLFWWGPRAGKSCEALIQAFCPQDQQELMKGLLRFAGLDKPVLAVNSVSSEGVSSIVRAGTGNLLCQMASVDPTWTIPVFAGAVLPALGSAKETGKQANCTNNLKQIGVALMMYENDHKCFPKQSGFAGLEELRKEAFDEPRAFVCPSSGKTPAKNGEPLSEENCSYIYFGGLTSTSATHLPIVMEIPGNHDKKLAYLRLDGAVFRIDIKATTAEGMVYAILGKTIGFSPDEARIVRQAKAWDRVHSK